MYEMKESGIEWIGQIPKHWEVRKNKYVLRSVYSGGTPLTSVADFYSDNEGINFVTIADMSNTEFVKSTVKLITEKGCAQKKLKILSKGTILFSIYATIGAVAELKIPATINQAILALEPYNIYKEYYKYNLKAMNKYLLTFVSTNTQGNLNLEKVLNLSIIFPPLNEQKKIADFLDNKVSKIDDLISDTKNLINKYKEYKQSLITETVTKGLNHKVEMKNSGIEWIGRIPKHWKVKIIQELFYNLKHRNIGIKEKNLLSLSYGKIINKDIYSNYGLLPVNFNNYNIVKYDDIVLRLTDLQNDKKSLRVGHVREKGIITSAYITLRPLFHYSSRYYYFLLHSYDICKYFYSLGSGVRQSLTFEEVKKILLLLPPIDEQEEIVKYLDDKCQQIESIIEEKQALIEKLEEYKKSLIYEYVTGKKQVENE